MKPITTQQFIKKAQLIHGYRYDYSMVNYHGRSTPVTIRCPKHGLFSQLPVYHILRRSGCSACYGEGREVTQKQFLERCLEKFGETYTYGVYTGYRNPIEVSCPTHGAKNTTPQRHLSSKFGCAKCRHKSLRHDSQEWISKFRKHHGDSYEYKSPITVSDQKFEIHCPQHGPFFATPNNHSRGHGCPTCACVDKYVGGYSEEYFTIHPEKKQTPGILYVILIQDNSESFIKIGITNRSVTKRFVSLPYKYTTLFERQMELYRAHVIEEKLLASFKKHQYIPQVWFAGWTECFKVDIQHEVVNQLI